MKKNTLLIALSAVFLAACSTTPTPTADPVVEDDTMAVEDTTMMEETTLMTKQYTLTEQSDSGQTGTFTLTENATGGVTAVLSMTGGNFTEPQPAHIHVGNCPTPGAVEYPLTNIVNGESTTELEASMAEILASSPELAVNVHKSAAEASVYTACADIQ